MTPARARRSAFGVTGIRGLDPQRPVTPRLNRDLELAPRPAMQKQIWHPASLVTRIHMCPSIATFQVTVLDVLHRTTRLEK